jgi:ABC-2 type transport system permease protein
MGIASYDFDCWAAVFVKAMPDWQVFIAELSASPLTSAIAWTYCSLKHRRRHHVARPAARIIAVMFGAALTMIRHTRTEEASGRNELILGRPVGRYANLLQPCSFPVEEACWQAY